MVPGQIHAGVCGLALLGAAAVDCAGGNGQCDIHTDEADFLAAVAELGLTLTETEDFEGSNLEPFDYAGLTDPLEGGVPNVDAKGLGFPAGLSGTLMSLQSNIVQQNADSASPGSGLAAIGPWFLNPLIMEPESVEVGADIFVESTDLLFPFGSDVAAVGFRLRVAFDVSAEVAVFEVFDDVLEVRQTVPVAPGQDVFVGVVCFGGFTEIGRINVGGPGGELVDDVQLWQAPLGCPTDCGDGDGLVGIVDFLAVLAQWGMTGGSCDFNGTGVGINEFLLVLATWGSCPE